MVHRPTMPLWAVPEFSDHLLGRTLRSYRLLARIGSGGMGVVYRAAHLRLAREVAIKVLKPELAGDSRLVARFLSEARAVNQIHHPNLVEVIDVDEEPGDPPVVYMVMELLRGVDLAEHIGRHGPLDALSTVEIADAVADALVAVHHHRILHRDLKAENIFLVRREGGGRLVKLLDFGIATSLDGARLTEPGTRTGTPEHMAPEQIAGHAIDERTDIYSFGIVLYHMLSGRLPFRADRPKDVLSLQLHVQPPPLISAGTGASIPAALASVVMRCLEKRPADRYPSMAQVRQAMWAAVRAPDVVVTSQPEAGPAEALTPPQVATSPPASNLGAVTWDFAPARLPLLGVRFRRRLGLLAAAVVGAVVPVVCLISGGTSGHAPAPRYQTPVAQVAPQSEVVRAVPLKQLTPVAAAVRKATALRPVPARLSRSAVESPRRRSAKRLPPPAAATRARRVAAPAKRSISLDRTIDPFALGNPPVVGLVASGRRP